MSCRNTVSSRKRGPYLPKKNNSFSSERSIPQIYTSKYCRGPYHSESGDRQTKRAGQHKRGPYLRHKTEPIAKKQLSESHCAPHQVNVTTCELQIIEEISCEGATEDSSMDNFFGMSEPETVDLDQDSTKSDSGSEFSQESYEDSDDEDPCSNNEMSSTNPSLGNNSPPLYKLPASSSCYAAPITKKEHLTMVISYALKHCLTYQAFQDLLNLINLHCPQPNLCELSVFKAKASFVAIEDKIIYHDYCESCFLLYAESEVVCQNCMKEENGGKIR